MQLLHDGSRVLPRRSNNSRWFNYTIYCRKGFQRSFVLQLVTLGHSSELRLAADVPEMRRISHALSCLLLLCTNLEVEALLHLGEGAQQHMREYYRKKNKLGHSPPCACPHVCSLRNVRPYAMVDPGRYAPSPLSAKIPNPQRKLTLIPRSKACRAVYPTDSLTTTRGTGALSPSPKAPVMTPLTGSRMRRGPLSTVRGSESACGHAAYFDSRRRYTAEEGSDARALGGKVNCARSRCHVQSIHTAVAGDVSYIECMARLKREKLGYMQTYCQ